MTESKSNPSRIKEHQTMNRRITAFVVWSLFTGLTLAQERAQEPKPPAEQAAGNVGNAALAPSPAEMQLDAIKQVEFLAGNWRGIEWVLTPDGIRQNVEASDLAEIKLQGTVLLFQGTLKARIPPTMEPVVVYEGLGLLSYDENTRKYRLQHFGTDGTCEAYDGELSGRTLRFERRDKANVLTRVTLGLDDTGRWVERGDRSPDGKTWRQFFEVKMEKAPAGPEASK